MLTHERVRQAFDYDPLEGILRWKISPGNRKIKAGRIAGSKPCPRGYIYVRLDRERYGIHRLIWFWMTAEWPTETIDHRDLNPSNNQWINLREANESEQRWNMGLTRRNRSGSKGVDYLKRLGKWRARISIDNNPVHLGVFDTKEDAALARNSAALVHHGEFARV